MMRDETISARPIDWTIGPFHSILPGPFELSARLDGEVVSEAAVRSGFSARGMEQVLSRSSWLQGIPIMDRLDPDAAIFGEWAYCLALEKALRVAIPPRAQAIRVLLAELTRVSAHLQQLSTVARAAGSEVVFHFLLREREHVLDLMELVSGARHAPAFLRIGGVREDVSEGFLDRLQEVCQRVLERVSEYNDLLTYNEAFVRRVAGRAVITRAMVVGHGISGIPARIFDSSADLRWSGALPGYQFVQHQKMAENPPVGVAGDLHHRFVFKLQELIQSAQLIQELTQHLPPGACRAAGDFTVVPAGQFAAEVEAPRGRLRVEVTSTGGRSPASVKFVTPSEALFAAMPDFLAGAPIEDLKLWLSSLDIQISEVDR